MLLHRLTPHHAADLADLHTACFGNDAWSEKSLAETLALQTTEGWAIIEEETIRAFILCQKMEPEIEILTLCTAPTTRRQGLAQKLLDQMLTYPQGTILHLEVAFDNKAARNLYEKSGFQEVGRRPSYYKTTEKQVDGLRLQKAI